MERFLSGSTLLEVLIAMLISSVVFLSAVSVIINSFGRNRLIREFYWQTIVNNQLMSKLSQMDYYDRDSDSGEYIIKENVVDYEGHSTLWLVSVIVYDYNGTKLATARAIVRKKPHFQ